MTLKVIFDGTVNPESISLSETFKHGQFLIFDAPGLPIDEGVQIGFSLVTKIPLIGVNRDKIVPVSFMENDLSLTLDTNILIKIPREFSESGYEFYCGFGTTVSVALRVYVDTSDVTQESISETLDKTLANTEEIKNVLAIAPPSNFGQNTAILPLATGLEMALNTPLSLLLTG